MKRGAIASSVGHDSHNITVVGADKSTCGCGQSAGRARRRLRRRRGRKVLAELALPVAGLMTCELRGGARG